MTALAHEIARAVNAGTRSAADVAAESLRALDANEPRLHAFITVFRERALAAAKRVDERVRAGERLALAGVPIAIKDNLCLGPDLARPGDGEGYGGPTTCACRMLEHYHSPFTATCVQRLIDAGAVVVGKTNLDEFAMGSSTEHSAFGATRNPWDTSRVPGGSSGGSAAAVAARVVPIALGSDTGGSIRQPAGHCGVVGVKPTYGRVSRLGLVAYASSLDQVGPLAACVDDAALALRVMAGHDPGDSTSAQRPVPDWSAEVERPVRDLIVGVPRQAMGEGCSEAVRGAFLRAVSTFREMGASVVEVDLPTVDAGIAAYYVVATAEASSNLARFDGIRFGRRVEREGDDLAMVVAQSRAEGLGAEVKRRIMLGTHVLSSGYYDAYYATALRARRKLLGEFTGAFERCHCLLMPSAPGPAFAFGAKSEDPLAMYLEDVYTVGVNLAGLPAVSLPMGFAQEGGVDLPLGLQVIGPPFEEGVMLRAARQFEREVGLWSRVPPGVA